jgi:hypothetical protein
MSTLLEFCPENSRFDPHWTGIAIGGSKMRGRSTEEVRGRVSDLVYD